MVVVAPLDWGLGHATRCIPIIKELQAFYFDVIIACTRTQKSLLGEEFPECRFEELPGYEIVYGKTGFLTFFKLFSQTSKIRQAIEMENAWLKTFAEKNRIDLIISDNRYGFWHKSIPSVFITHQLTIKTSLGKLVDEKLRQINYRYIENFRECWIPDFRGTDNLAGELSHPPVFPQVSIKYLGPLSRFEDDLSDIRGSTLLIMLSGPEPQRSILEKKVLGDLKDMPVPTVLLRGLPGQHPEISSANENLMIFNHLPTAHLKDAIHNARLVICRAGYSSVMDLVPRGKSCAFIPTPGQTEQQYLAKYLADRHYCLGYEQRHFSLKKVLAESEDFTPALIGGVPGDSYKRVINEAARRFIYQH